MALLKGLIKKLNKMFPPLPEFNGEVYEDEKEFISDDVKKAWGILIVGHEVKYNFNTQRFERKPLTCFDNVKDAFNELYPNVDAYVNEAFYILNKEAIEYKEPEPKEPQKEKSIFEFDESEVLSDD